MGVLALAFARRNLANFFTCIRIVLIPVVVWLIIVMNTQEVDASHFWALLVFVFAALTDFIDGQLARRLDIITEFGKIVDPLADRLLVISVLIALMIGEFMPIWMGVLIIARDVIILLGAPFVGITDKETREKLAVHWTGKAATAFLFTAICLFILLNLPGDMHIIGFIVFCIGIFFSYLSGFIYFLRGIKLMRGKEEVAS
jgi:CDP-diacylglycerol--glycerol-3-phosphate 3-phosphatidyltransferase